MDTFSKIQSPFQEAEKAMQLKVKPSKCKLVLLCAESEVKMADVSAWLTSHAPRWRAMSVCRAAKYLGHWMGPDAFPLVWKGPEAKFRLRVRELAAVGAAAFETAKDYNAMVVPVLQYIAKLHRLPASLQSYERHALTTVLHMPPSTMGLAELLDLDSWNGPSFRSMTAMAGSMALRTAWRFYDCWNLLAVRLKQAAEDSIPWHRLALGADLTGKSCLLLNFSGKFGQVSMRLCLARLSPGYQPSSQVQQTNAPSFASQTKEKCGNATPPTHSHRCRHRILVSRPQSVLTNSYWNRTYRPNGHSSFRNEHTLTMPTSPELQLSREGVRDSGSSPSFEAVDAFTQLAKSTSRQLRPYVSISALKNLCCGWTTSHRMHGDDAGAAFCKFGCTVQGDSMSHYVRCVRLREI